MLVCVEREREKERDGWRKQIQICLAAQDTIFSSCVGNGGTSARCALKLFNHFFRLSVKDREYSNKCWPVFVGVAVNKGTQCSFKVFVLDQFVRARREEGDEAVGVGTCKVSVFFRVARSEKSVTLYPSHSYTHKQATH